MNYAKSTIEWMYTLIDKLCNWYLDATSIVSIIYNQNRCHWPVVYFISQAACTIRITNVVIE